MIKILCLISILLITSTAQAAVKVAHPRLLITDSHLATLRQKAIDNTTEWAALKSYCDTNIGTNLTDSADGDAWHKAAVSYSLAWLILKDTNTAQADLYGQRATTYISALVNDMATVGDAAGGVPAIEHDNGYPIRFRGAFTAVAYDWLYDYSGFSAELKEATRNRLNEWITWYSTGGYCRNEPISNYHAGYFMCKAFVTYGTYYENPSSTTHLNQWNTMYAALRDTYTVSLNGGDWSEGWNYGPGTVDRVSQAIYAVKTATEEDLFAEFDWPRQTIYMRTHTLFPNRGYVYDGGSWTGSFRGDPRKAEMYTLSHIFAGTEAGRRAQYYADNLTYCPITPPQWQTFIYYNPDGDATAPADLNTVYVSTSSGFAAMRSDWVRSSSATWASFQCGPYLSAQGSQNRDQGHFRIWKYDQLAHDVAVATQTWSDGLATGFHNCITIDDKGESYLTYPPGQGIWGDASMTRSTTTANYSYFRGDIQPTYLHNSLTKNAVRKHNRTFIYLPPDYFVVWDDIETEKPHFEKSWRANFRYQPTVNVDSSTVYTKGDGKLYVAPPIYPDNYTLIKTTCSDVNSATKDAWRLQIIGSTSPVTTGFLNFLFATSTHTATMPTTSRVSDNAGAMLGVHISSAAENEAWCVMVSTGSQNVSTTTFTLDGTGAIRVLVCDITPGTTVHAKRDGVEVSSGVVGTDGTYYFASTLGSAHTFEVSSEAGTEGGADPDPETPAAAGMKVEGVTLRGVTIR